MLGKIKTFFGLDEVSIIEPAQADSSLIELKALQAENRELRKIIKQKNAQLQELSQENMDLGRDRREMADALARKQRIIDAYKCQVV